MSAGNCFVEGSHTNNVLSDILAKKSVRTLFHPICSVTKRQVFGVEALSRGDYNDSVFSPPELFSYAVNPGDILDLDRIFREKAIKNYSLEYKAGEQNPLLFLNINTSVLIGSTIGSNSLADLVCSHGIEPQEVVIELLESGIENEEILLKFVNNYREMGFRIALDDVGAGCSNLNRMVAIQPSIIKIDRFLIQDIHQEFYKRSVFKGIVSIAHDIGAMVVAEGVETEQEALVCLEDGADYLQGFYFCKPLPSSGDISSVSEKKLKTLASSFKYHCLTELKMKKRRSYEQITTLKELVKQITTLANLDYDEIFRNLKAKNSNLECFYILNEHGVQLSTTVGGNFLSSGQLYQPAGIGFDHGMKRYVISLQSGLTRYISGHYLSLASGRVCQTLAELIEWKGVRYILCIDFTY